MHNILWEQAQILLERGGLVLATILILSTLMWILIIERYLFFYRIHPRLLRQAVAEWRERTDHSSTTARRIRDGMISELSTASQRFLLPIETITTVLPLLGLLGTVIGMIKTFDVMMVFGTGNGRGFAEGISQALINSTAGLVAAIAGIYFAARLKRRAEKEQQLVTDRLI